MSARKIGHSEFFEAAESPKLAARLHLPASAVNLRQNGIEFHSESPIPAWTEIDLSLETNCSHRKFHGKGVVVACDGDRATGFRVAVVFTALSRQAQAQLNTLVFSGLA